MVKLTNEEYIIRSNKTHNEFYGYSKTIYIGANSSVIIFCPVHGDFSVNAYSHLRGTSCKKCKDDDKKMSNDIFISKSKRLHNNFYSYPNTQYLEVFSNVDIECPVHGNFSQQANSHLNGSGCMDCFLEKQKSNSIVFKKKANLIHNNLYIYYDDYEHSKKEIMIGCKKHGLFPQTPNSHLQGCGCPSCKTSKGENRIQKYLIENNIVYESQKKFDGLKYKSELMFDFYLPEHNICIEYDGEQHFKIVEFYGGRSGFMIRKHRDLIKNKYCSDNNIALLRIPYHDYNKIERILRIFY